MNNINTREYWEQRFSSGDWEKKQGRWQTHSFANAQNPYLELDKSFEGTILDYGCGLGDAMPTYREAFPRAKLIGIDISSSAIEQCRNRYGLFATFEQGDHTNIPKVDVIIASNVLEHLSDDLEVAKHLVSNCRDLYIFVPYKERPLCSEHVNTYDEKYYSELGEYNWSVFYCKGWSLDGIELWYHIYFKNVFRFILRSPILHRGRQIMFQFRNSEWEAISVQPDGIGRSS